MLATGGLSAIHDPSKKASISKQRAHEADSAEMEVPKEVEFRLKKINTHTRTHTETISPLTVLVR